MATIDRALQVAARAHEGQRDVLSYRFLTDQIDEPAYRQLMRDAEI